MYRVCVRVCLFTFLPNLIRLLDYVVLLSLTYLPDLPDPEAQRHSVTVRKENSEVAQQPRGRVHLKAEVSLGVCDVEAVVH